MNEYFFEWIFWILFWIEFWIESFFGPIQLKNEFSKCIEQGYLKVSFSPFTFFTFHLFSPQQPQQLTFFFFFQAPDPFIIQKSRELNRLGQISHRIFYWTDVWNPVQKSFAQRGWSQTWSTMEDARTGDNHLPLPYHHLHHCPPVIAKITTLQKVDILYISFINDVCLYM